MRRRPRTTLRAAAPACLPRRRGKVAGDEDAQSVTRARYCINCLCINAGPSSATSKVSLSWRPLRSAVLEIRPVLTSHWQHVTGKNESSRGEKGLIEGVEGPDLSVKWKKGLARAHTAGPAFSSEARHKQSAGGKVMPKGTSAGAERKPAMWL